MSSRRIWTPYLLILPAVLYLAIFFAWPMLRAVRLAAWDDDGKLTLYEEARHDSAVAGILSRGTQVAVKNRQANPIAPGSLASGGLLLTEIWYQVTGEDVGGETITGWVSESRIRVREESADGTPVQGSVRQRIGVNADPLTTIVAEPSSASQEVGKLDAGTPVNIDAIETLEVWYQVESADGEVSGWAPSRYVQVFGEGESGRIDRGDTGQWTMAYIQAMLNDRFFRPALRTTLLLLVLIIPIQLVLAIAMALVIQQQLPGHSLFLYIFSIPLGVSDLAVGLIWFAVFTQNGYLNSILQGLGVIDGPITYLAADKRNWIILAIWLAEIWRSTSIVMVIVVSGFQAITNDVLEAADLDGTTFMQRVWYIILPLLRPSLQVALILRTILAFQVFAVIVALGGGTVVTVLAHEAFRQYYFMRNPNLSAVYASFILLLSLITAAVYLRVLRTQDEELAA